MVHSKIVLLFMSFLFLGSCFGPAVVERTDTDYEIKKAEDEDRDEVIERTAQTIRGDTEKCEDKDKKHKCYEYCDDMFRSNRDEEDCEELTVAQVEAMWELYELLEDPDVDELEDINSEVFDLYLNISIKSLDDLIGKYSRSDAKEFLIWLINNEEIAKIFKKEDDEHKSFEALLKKFSGSYTSSGHDISTPFLKKLDRDKLIEESMGSEWMLEWFQDYINEKNSACKSDTETRSCFAVYCKIGEGMDDDVRDDWLDSGDFESYIEDIIEEKVNSRQGVGDKRNASGWIHEDASGSDSDEIGDVRDIDDNWVDDLCQGLTGGTAGGGSGNNNNNNNNNNNDNSGDSDDSSDDDEEELNLPDLCDSVDTEAACINHLLSDDLTEASMANADSKEALSWIFSTEARATKFLKRANFAGFRPFEKFLSKLQWDGLSFNDRSDYIFVGFVADVKPGKNLMELALDTNTANYIVEYINSRRACNHEINRGWGRGVNSGCFRAVYCAIAHHGALSVADLKKWFDTPNFKAYLTKVINLANGVGTGPYIPWGKENLRNDAFKAGVPDPVSINDIKNDWKTGLCKLTGL